MTCPPNSHGEDSDRWRLDRGNESTARSGSDDARVAIFLAVSTRQPGRPIFPKRLFCGTIFPPALKEMVICGNWVHSCV
jgi:hypothetical protein